MFWWLPYPMVRVALVFVAGVLCAVYAAELIPVFAILLSAALAAIGFLVGRIMLKGELQAVVCGLLGLLSIFFLGYARLLLGKDVTKEDHILHLSEPIAAYQAIILGTPESRPKFWRVEVDVDLVKTTTWQRAQGKVLLYISKEKGDVKWQYGDRILVKGAPAEVKAPLNPGEFDFRQYLGFKNIHHQQFLSHDQAIVVCHTTQKGFIYYSQLARGWASGQLRRYIQGEREQAIAGALVLGVTDGIDPDLQSAYAASGALHVLSVSGLHVGVIYAIILFLLNPFQSRAWGAWVIALLSLLCLWIFAFVTGLSPSVFRAVTMFSFVVVAKPFSRHTNIFNTLASSVFLLLVYDPFLIMSVGFQLSYLAVLGIVYWQRRLYDLWEINNRAGDWVWKLTTVSLAAQAATMVLGVLYFNQFPVYFLLSNLIVIPLSTFILVGGVALLAVASIPLLSSWIGTLTDKLIQLLNWVVVETEQLPFSVISNIHINSFQCCLVMSMILSMVLLFRYRTIRWLYVGIALAFTITFTQWVHFHESVNNSQWTVYSLSGHRYMEWTIRGHSYFTADSSFLGDEKKMNRHVAPCQLMRGVSVKDQLIPFRKSLARVDFYTLAGKQIIHLVKPGLLPNVTNVDYVVISNNAIAFKDVKNHIQAPLYLLDGSNSRKFAATFKEQARKQKQAVYDVMEEGAFVSEL